MQGQQTQSFSTFENLEKRVLFSQIHVADFSANPDDGRDDRGSIQAAIDASQPGDTIAFDAGAYDVGGALQFRSNRSYAGVRGTELNFSNTNFGVHLEADAQDVTIERFVFNHAGIDMGSGGPGSGYRNIRILGNAFRDIPTNAIKATVSTDHLKIDGNEFRNVNGYGVFEIYNPDHFSFQHNHVIDSKHGGHLLGPGNDNVLAHNLITGLQDWGFEIQRSGESVSENLLVEDNVIYGFKRAYGNSGGLSVIAEHGRNTIVRNNYIRADHEGVPLEEGHMHVGIEAGFDTGEVSGNVIGGDRKHGNLTHYISASGPDMKFKNNKFYGSPQWGSETVNWAGDMPGGHGWFHEENNSRNKDFSRMPDPWTPGKKRRESNDDSPAKDDRGNKHDDRPDDAPPIKAAPPVAPDHGVWISDLDWQDAINGWGPVETDQSNGERSARDGENLSLDGKEYRKGLGVAINSEVTYDLNGEYRQFFSDIGIDDYAEEKGSATFEIWADGKKVFDSGKMTHNTRPIGVSIDVSDVKTLKLVTTDAGDGGNSDHADWAGARLTLANA